MKQIVEAVDSEGKTWIVEIVGRKVIGLTANGSWRSCYCVRNCQGKEWNTEKVFSKLTW